jgi:holliday junction DNA helicase RuvA
MIGYLSGVLHSKYSDSIILLVNGIGYQVYLPSSMLTTINISTPLELYIHTHVKEESLDLFGFKTPEDLALYKILLNVSGIGAKTALNIIDKGSTPVKNAVMNADVEFFRSLPRLGTKNAQRIIIELKNKIGSLSELDLSTQSTDNLQITEALQSMGYTKHEAQKVLKQIPSELSTIEEKIRFALRNMGK